MLYEEYENKLNRRKEIFARVWKYRLLILISFICLLAAFVVMGLVGTVTKENFRSEIYYGDSLSPVSFALFNDVKYEYKVNGEWGNSEPILCGTYEFRAVSHGLAGRTKYGKSHTYSILPSDVYVEIDDAPVLFGENPSYSLSLKFNDVGYVDDFLFEREGDSFSVSADIESVKIEDEDGNDVTFCYKVFSTPKNILTMPRAITIKTGSEKWTYDGLPHSNEELYIVDGELLDGHYLTTSFITATEAGSVPNSLESILVTDEKGEDVSAFYNISVDEGVLEIAKRQFTITTMDSTFTYDGIDHSCGEFDVEGLLEGHTFSGTAIDPATLKEVDSVENRFKVDFTILNGSIDVTSNYEPVYSYGTISIIKRSLSIVTHDATFVYDGQPHACLGFDLVDNTVPVHGHRVKADSEGYIDITDDENMCSSIDNVLHFSIEGANGRDVTDNYEITCTYGRIRIKSPIVVRISALSKHYDGTPLSFEGDEFSIVKLPPDVDKGEVNIVLKGSIIAAGALVLDELRALSTVEVSEDNRVDFVCASDPLVILKREIEVSSVSIHRAKGDEAINGNVEGAAWISLGSLVRGHDIRCVVTGRLEKNVASSKNTIASVKIFSGDKDVTSNYKITLKEGTLSWA